MSSSHTRRHDALLAVHNVGYTVPNGRSLFSNLTLGFGRERTGLVGRNGAGKSTLACLLTGVLTPTSGTVVRHGRVAILEQHRFAAAALSNASLSIGDCLGFTASAVLNQIGLRHLNADRSLHTLSGGERTRVALAHTLLDHPDFVILDEPTNDLDAHSRHALYRAIDTLTCGLLVISHDRELLHRMDRIIELDERGVSVYGGNFATYEQHKLLQESAARDDIAQSAAALRKARAVAQETTERQNRRAQRGKKSRINSGMPKILLGKRRETSERTTARLSRTGARVIDEELTRLQQAKARADTYVPLAMAVPTCGLHRSRTVFRLHESEFAYDTNTNIRLLFPAFTIVGPERVAITGANGTGKSTLLRLVTGQLSPTRETLERGIPPADMAYLDQTLSCVNRRATILDSVLAADATATPGTARQLLARYKFRGDAVHRLNESLSGGERLRVALACTLERSTPPQLLVLDEPTNHLDLDSLRVVESALNGYDGALLVVSHDAEFLRRINIERQIHLPPNE